MKHTIVLVGFILTAPGAVFAADLKTYKGRYDVSLQQIVLDHETKMSELGQHYTKSLDMLLVRTKKEGSLDKTVAVMKEKARFEDDASMPGEMTELPDIRKMQAAYSLRVSALEKQKAKTGRSGFIHRFGDRETLVITVA
jgi:hypothetical protein